MNVYRIDVASGNASTRFWVDAPNMIIALLRGALSGLRSHRPLSHRPITSFSVTREIA